MININFEQQNIIYLRVISHLNDLNDLLQYSNNNIDSYKFTDFLNKRNINLDTVDMNEYLASVLLLVFKLNKNNIKISKNENEKFIIVNFVNTILDELNIEQIGVD